ncbi:hypothetical protein N7495_001405 [Penicillium taxi]|uniref:uncharacterized protein n=1 Tax=Penicillium taxi TaxID=168475 RepID=UPI002544DB8C|nr:uncharacterized protein N7495_001405 [Penicillium taxi]KAJ5908723.1 hypothetical protein N7495_001405 [Penicillium taxi]
MGLEEKYPAYGGRGPGDLRLGLGLGATATIFMVLRVYVRLRVNKFGTAALIWSIAAWIVTIVTQTMSIIAILHGLGNHIGDLVKTNELGNYLLFTWITVFFFNMAIPIGKVAVCSFLIEMNAQGNPKIRMSLMVVAGLNVLFSIPQVIICWTQCSPPSALWDPLRQADCHPERATYYTYFIGAVAVVSDLYLAIIPAAMLVPLKIDRRLKWGLSFLMGCGIFAAIAAIIRTWAAKSMLGTDPSYGSGVLFQWGQVEEWVLLISMSIPPVWPLFRPWTKKFFPSSSRPYDPYSGKGYDQFASTGRELTNADPPVVTTTISVMSNKGTKMVEGESTGAASSSDSIIKYNAQEEAVLRQTGDPAAALSREKESDDHIAATGKLVGPFHGLPISIKESFSVTGVDTSLGVVSMLDRLPIAHDSEMVEILIASGAVLYIKHEDSQNNVFGRILNPYSTDITVGGSSGGEASLIAMRFI